MKKPLAAKPEAAKWNANASRPLNIEATTVQLKVVSLADAIRNDMWWNDQLVNLWIAEAERAKLLLDSLIFSIHDHITANKP